ncbi:dynein axonemal light chain 1-like [Daphnia carinata]|uniref:dynein axonemal light chain 1-like n=1 Tax=Daphnia carinata TaxID=120202 RepID=UPI00257DB0BA|nr:dynein axonemal light chain 1-like [Daphnia carinata]
MWNAMSMKEAVKQWEAHTQQKISTAVEIKLIGICPSLDKMDTVMLSFITCEKLSLSSNNIERIANLGSMKHLKILSLGRNSIKSISGIEAVSETLEELWISYNQIEKLKGIGVMKKLRVLTMSNNLVREWAEFMRLAEVPNLKELVFVGNPLEERCTSEGVWRSEVVRRLPNLAKLDGQQCMETEVNLSDAQTELRPTSAESEDNEEGDARKFKNSGDEEEENEEEEDEDEVEEEEEGDEEETQEENPENCIEPQMELSVTSNPVTHCLEPVTEEIGLKEE